VDLDNIVYGGDETECYFACMLLNPIAFTIPRWQTFKRLIWAPLLNRLVDLVQILYGGDGTEYYLDYVLVA
jgi:hypothetical protein